MGQSIAVMNTKGGVGKSTIVMALAETLSVFHDKNVLVIDSDSQTSMSIMLMDMERWEAMERKRQTLVDYLSNMVLGNGEADWKPCVAPGVSDVDDAERVYLVPSHMNLSLFEREASAERRHTQLRRAIRHLLTEARQFFDIILIDCPPGLSVLTECWLREADYFLPPTKPDYLSVRGLSILKRFRELSHSHGFAQLLGVLVNLKDDTVQSEEEWHRRLLADPSNRCFEAAVPRRPYIQRAGEFQPGSRTFIAKYPGDAGRSIRSVAAELVSRLEQPVKADPARPQPELERECAAEPGAGHVDATGPENQAEPSPGTTPDAPAEIAREGWARSPDPRDDDTTADNQTATPAASMEGAPQGETEDTQPLDLDNPVHTSPTVAAATTAAVTENGSDSDTGGEPALELGDTHRVRTHASGPSQAPQGPGETRIVEGTDDSLAGKVAAESGKR